MNIAGRVVVAGTEHGVGQVMVSLTCGGDGGSIGDVTHALTQRRFLGTAQTDVDGRFTLEAKLDPKRGSDCQEVFLVVSPPKLARDSNGKHPEVLQVMEMPMQSSLSDLRVSVPADILGEAGVTANPADDAFRLLSSGWAEMDRMRALVKPVAGPRFEASFKVAEQARAKVHGLTTASKHLIASGLLASAAAPGKAEAKAKTVSARRLSAYGDQFATGIQLWWEPGALARHLGVDPSRLDEGIPITRPVCSLLPSMKGPELERIRDLLDTVPAQEEPGSDGGDPEPAASDDAPETVEAALALATRQRVNALIAPAHQEQAVDGLRRIQRSLQEFQLPAGPADDVAYHDFYALQIAFEHVWEEAFDGGLRSRAEDLYESVVRLHDEYGLDVDWVEDAQDIGDLRRFLSDVDRRRRSIPLSPPPTTVVTVWPQLSFSAWNELSCAQQLELTRLAKRATDGRSESDREQARRNGLRIIASPDGPLLRVEKLLLELRERLAEPHAFHYFAPNSVNYGILLTYRQAWHPEAYQVGQLVSSIPLAPSESRRLKVMEKSERSRTQRELESSLRAFRDSQQQARRAQSEIVRRAQTATNFQQTVQGSLNFGLGQIGGSTMFGLNQANESARTKQAFRESVHRSAQEFRNERRVEVEEVSSEEQTTERMREISNPNDEITVTYLLYELERRYRVSESLHRLTPVVLVAQDVPAPNEIDDDWLLAHEWILRRVLLDDSFAEALDLLRDGFVGEEAGVAIKQDHWRVQKGVVEALQVNLQSLQTAESSLQQRLVNTMLDEGLARAGEADDEEKVARAFASGGWSLLFDGSDDPSKRFEAMRKSFEVRLEQLQQSISQGRSDLKREASLLEAAERAYTEAMRKKMDRRTLVDQLRVHVKENILHYMQAIWDHEPTDQRFFRLYHVEVPVPTPPPGACRLRRATAEEREHSDVVRRGGELYVVECSPPDPSEVETRPLGEIADIDRPLGFKGNYIIYPLRECTYLTNYMMQEYVDDYLGIRDPDRMGEFSTAELAQLRQRAGTELPPEVRSALDRLLAQRLTGPGMQAEQLVVPTGQLMMEVIPGEHPVLERFKHLHRAMDLVKVENEIRMDELESIRYAARLTSGILEDPEVDRRVVVEGADVSIDADA